MKNFKLILPVFIILAAALNAAAQRNLSGKVVEVLDGKTAVVQIGTSGKLKVVLQYVEIPEPEQPFHHTVKEHLEKLVLGKDATVIPKGVFKASTIGQVFVDGVDVSQQMLRDGAAWYAIPEKSGQSASESEIYQGIEAQARSEKRGVWSDEKIKPAWEFRAEREARKKAEETARLEEIKRRAVAARTAKAKKRMPSRILNETDYNLDLWGNLSRGGKIEGGNFKGFGGLYSGSLPQYRIGYVVTDPSLMKLADKNKPRVMTFRAMYLYKQYQDTDPNAFFLAFESDAERYKFLEASSLTLYADKQKINIGKALRLHRMNGDAAQELLLYKVQKSVILKIAKAKDLSMRVGRYSAKIGGNYQEIVNNLLSASE